MNFIVITLFELIQVNRFDIRPNSYIISDTHWSQPYLIVNPLLLVIDEKNLISFWKCRSLLRSQKSQILSQACLFAIANALEACGFAVAKRDIAKLGKGNLYWY